MFLTNSTHDSLLAKEDVDHSDILLPRIVLVVSLVLKSAFVVGPLQLQSQKNLVESSEKK